MLFEKAANTYINNNIEQDHTNDIYGITQYLKDYDNSVETETESPEETAVSKYVTSLATSCYKKSIEDIENTKLGNTVKRKRNLQQIMQQSFFYGANRFGTNFIA